MAQGDDLAGARTTAHRLAAVVEPALAVERLRARFAAAGAAAPAAVFDVAPLKHPRDREAAVAAWLDAATRQGVGRLPKHPVFHHDWGRRLVGQFHLDVPALDASQLGDVVRLTIAHLREAATAT